MFPVSGRYSKTLYCRITFGYDVMWITVLIIVIVLGLGIGPVMWLMPSARQKQLAALRAHAATQGLKVRLVSVGQLGSVNLAAGEVVTLTFNNTQGGQIIVEKNATGPVGTTTTREIEAAGGPSTITPDPLTHNGCQSVMLDSSEQADYHRPGT